jgi:O-antigen/teichoic acid export membrane protein
MRLDVSNLAQAVEASPTSRLIAHIRTPLYGNGYALVSSSAVTSALGAAYWILAARLYTPEAVGLNSALISMMMLLAGISQLNLMSALNRFVPVAGRATRRLLIWSYLIAMVVAGLVGLAFARTVQTLAPALGVLAHNDWLALWFIAATMAWCVFVLQDSALVGLHQAVWVPIENGAFALSKIVLLVGIAGALPAFGLFASWSIPVMLVLLPTNLLIFCVLVPRHVREMAEHANPPVASQIARYVAGDYLGALFWIACTTLLPIMVVQQAGYAANAYFFLAWQVAFSLHLISPNMGSSLIAEAAADQEQLAAYAYQIGRQVARVVVPGALVLALAAPYILGVFGSEYASQGTPVLRLLALAAIPNIVQTLFVSVARVQRRVGAVALTLGVFCAGVLGLSYVLLPRLGIVGVGLAWLAVETALAVVLLLGPLRGLWWSSWTGLGPVLSERDPRWPVA